MCGIPLLDSQRVTKCRQTTLKGKAQSGWLTASYGMLPGDLGGQNLRIYSLTYNYDSGSIPRLSGGCRFGRIPTS